MTSHPSIFWLNLETFLGFLGTRSSKIANNLCSLRRYWSFFVGTLDSFSRFLKHIMFLVETRQSFLQIIGNTINFIFFRKTDSKKNKQWFWDQNRNQKYKLFWNNLLASLLRLRGHIHSALNAVCLNKIYNHQNHL